MKTKADRERCLRSAFFMRGLHPSEPRPWGSGACDTSLKPKIGEWSLKFGAWLCGWI